MKKILYGFCALLGLSIVAAFIVPGFIDWDRYKDQMVARASQELGRDIFVDGQISLTILPIPTFSVTGVRVANLPGAASHEMVRLKSLNVQVEPLPLLVGSIEVARIVLIEPDIVLERFPDGSANWIFPLSATERADASRVGSDSALPRVALDEIHVQNGALKYFDSVKGLSERIEKIDLIVSAPSLLGPFDISGAINFRGSRVEIPAGILEVVNDKQIGVSATLVNNGLSINIAATSDPARAPFIDGRVSIKGSDLDSVSKFVGTFIEGPFSKFAETSQPISLDSEFSYHREVLKIDSLAMRFGDISGAGSGEVSFSGPINYDISLALGRLDLDNLSESWSGFGWSWSQSHEVVDTDSPPQFDENGSTFFGSMTGALDITVDAVFYRSQAIRDLTIRVGTVTSGAIEVQELSAFLPGGSDVTFFGSLDYRKKEPHFLGEIKAGSENFRALLDWMDFDVAGVPADRLRRVNLSAVIDGAPTSGKVTDIDLHFDATHLTGGIAYAIHGSRPGFGVGLHVDQLNIDAYLPPVQVGSEQPSENTSAGGVANDGAATAVPPKFREALQVLSAFDADFNIGLNNLTFDGMPMSGLVLDGLLHQSSLNIRQVRIGDFAGSTVSFSGLVSERDGRPSVDGIINFSSEKLATLARKVPLLNGLPAGLLGPLRVDAKINGSTDMLELAGTIAALESELEIKGTFMNPLDSLQFDIVTHFESPSLASFVENITAGHVKSEVSGLELDGPISVALDVDGDFSTLHLEGVTKFANGEIEVGGSVSHLLDEPKIQIQGILKHPNLNSLLGVMGHEFDETITFFESPVALELGVGGLVTELDLQGRLILADLTMDFSGGVRGWPAPLFFESQIDVRHPDLNALLLNAGLFEHRLATKNPLTLIAEVHGTPDAFSVSKINLEIAETNISGSMAIEMDGERPKLTADLSAEELVMEHLLVPAILRGSDRNYSRSGDGPSVSVEKSPNVETETRWSGEPIDLTGLGKLDAYVELQANSVIFPKQKFSDARLVLHLDDNYLTINRLSGRVFDGEIEVSAKIDGRVPPRLELFVNVQGADIEELLSQVGQVDVLTGKIDVEFEITGQGRSQKELIASLSGEGRVKNASEGSIKGINLRSLSDQIGDMDDIGDVITLARVSFEGGATGYTEFGGHFNIVNGEILTDDFRVIVDGGMGEVVGVIDLTNLTQDLALVFRLTEHPEIPAIKMTLKGPLDNPNQGIETRGIEKFLLERGLAKMVQETVAGSELGVVAKVTEALTGRADVQNSSDDIRGAADALIDQLIGVNGSDGDEVRSVDGSAATPSSIPVDKDPEDLFKDLIKNLLRE